MARIANVNIPDNKRLVISLTYIYGIGLTSARNICDKVKIDFNKRVKELDDTELVSLRNEIEKNYIVEGALSNSVKSNIKRKKDNKEYQGYRHMRGLPVRGQNTKSNARTRKGKPKTIANKKK